MATATRPSAEGGGRSAYGLAFTISREQLLGGLSAVSAVIASNVTMPVLGHILIESSAKGIRITATDLDLSISRLVAADVEQEGSITLPAKRLLAIAKELPPAPVRVTVIKGDAVRIDCGRATFRLMTLPAIEFPTLPTVDFNAGSIPTEQFASMIKRTSFAASTESSRPTINGVLWQCEPETVRLVATSGHMLALVERPISAGLGMFAEVIVPPKALAQATRLFDAESEIELGASETHLGFQSETTTVITRLITGPYPNYEQVIPKKHQWEITVDRIALMTAVKRISPVATDETHRLTIKAASGMLSLSATTTDVGEGSDELPARIDGSDLKFGMNANYLLNVLAAIDSDTVTLRTKAADRAFVIEPAGSEQRTGRALYIVMPLRVLE